MKEKISGTWSNTAVNILSPHIELKAFLKLSITMVWLEDILNKYHLAFYSAIQNNSDMF